MHQLERDGSDNAAVEPTGAAQDERKQDIGRSVKVQAVERREVRRLREKRTRGARVAGRQCIDRGQTGVDGDPDRGGATRIVADRAQSVAERRVDDSSRKEKEHEQCRQAVEIRCASAEIERELSEQRAGDDALQTVGAAGDVIEAIGKLVENERDAECHHEPRQIRAAKDEHTRQQSQERTDGDGHREAHQGIRHQVLCEERGDVGAGPKECGVSERDDAAVAENQIE